MTITELIEAAHENAIDKGWYEEPRRFGELIALCHSELSEALEEYRRGHSITDGRLTCTGKPTRCSGECHKCDRAKPEGIPIELADVVIRIADMCGRYGIDLEAAIEKKMAFNKTRPHKHGNKRI